MQTVSLDFLANNAAFIITPNTRLAQFLSVKLDAWQTSLIDANESSACFSPIDVLAYNSWVKKLYGAASNIGLFTSGQKSTKVLDGFSERQLWKAVVQQSNPEILSSISSAKLAQKAYALCQDYDLSLAEHAFLFGATKDSRSFYQWHQKLIAGLNGRYLLDADLQRYLYSLDKEWLRSLSAMSAKNKAYAVGFVNTSAMQQKLFDKLGVELVQLPWYSFEKEAGVGVEESKNISAAKTARPKVVVDNFRSFEDEVKHALLWAKEYRERLVAMPNDSTDTAAPEVAVIVPELSPNLDIVSRLACEVFDKQNYSLGNHSYSGEYNISASYPLSQVPIVSHILLLLESLLGGLDRYGWQILMTSPYFKLFTMTGSAETVSAIYQTGEKKISMQQLQSVLDWAGVTSLTFSDECDGGDDTLDSDVIKRVVQASNSSSDLETVLHNILESVSFANARVLDSYEYQAKETFFSALDKLMVSPISEDITDLASLKKLLHEYLSEEPFHTETVKCDKPAVQILGLLEATGLTHDAVYICGLDEKAWPSPANPNPFIPVYLQSQRDMPSSSDEREFRYAETLLDMLLKSAPEVRGSYVSVQDGEPVSYSAILNNIADVVEISESDKSLMQNVKVECIGNNIVIDKALALEYMEDKYGQPYSWSLMSAEANENIAKESVETVLRGGTSFLTAQANNPLMAYLRFRLRLSELPEIQDGVTPIERGSILHYVLEEIWRYYKNRQRLCDADDAELRKIIDKALDPAMQKVFSKRFQAVIPLARDIEKRCLAESIYQWMCYEQSRQNFEIVALEKQVSVTVNGLTLHGVVDRIDREDDGSITILDYKTGRVALADLFAERLFAPQMPFYALALNQQNIETLSGLAYARIKKAQAGFEGIASQDSPLGQFDKVRHWSYYDSSVVDFSELLIDWREQLHLLVEEVIEGEVSVELDLDKIEEFYQSFYGDENALNPYLAFTRERFQSDGEG